MFLLLLLCRYMETKMFYSLFRGWVDAQQWRVPPSLVPSASSPWLMMACDSSSRRLLHWGQLHSCAHTPHRHIHTTERNLQVWTSCNSFYFGFTWRSWSSFGSPCHYQDQFIMIIDWEAVHSSFSECSISFKFLESLVVQTLNLLTYHDCVYQDDKHYIQCLLNFCRMLIPATSLKVRLNLC